MKCEITCKKIEGINNSVHLEISCEGDSGTEHYIEKKIGNYDWIDEAIFFSMNDAEHCVKSAKDNKDMASLFSNSQRIKKNDQRFIITLDDFLLLFRYNLEGDVVLWSYQKKKDPVSISLSIKTFGDLEIEGAPKSFFSLVDFYVHCNNFHVGHPFKDSKHVSTEISAENVSIIAQCIHMNNALILGQQNNVSTQDSCIIMQNSKLSTFSSENTSDFNSEDHFPDSPLRWEEENMPLQDVARQNTILPMLNLLRIKLSNFFANIL